MPGGERAIMLDKSQSDTTKQDDMEHIRLAVRQLCAKYGEEYWLNMDRTAGYPSDFVAELTASGFLGILIPEEYGGSGLGVAEAAVVMEEICRSGAHAGVARRKKRITYQKLLKANYAYRVLASLNPLQAAIPPASKPLPAKLLINTL
jgi:hypothetical protein